MNILSLFNGMSCGMMALEKLNIKVFKHERGSDNSKFEIYKKDVHDMDDLKKKIESKDQNSGLKKHFGKLKRNLDGLTYQQQIRSNED